MSADLRVVAVAASAWVGAAFGVVGNGRAFAGVVGSLAIAVFILRRRGWRSLASLLLIGVLVGGCLWVSSWSRIQANRTSVVHAVAAEQQLTRATVVVTSDPVSVRDGTGGVTTSRGVRVMARLEVLTMASSQRQVRSPVMVFAPASWQDLIPGDVVQSLITWTPPRTPELAAVGSTTMAPTVVKSAPWIQRAAQTLRAGLRSACEGQSATTGAVLVPALVVGDTSTMPESLVDDLRLSGLAHLSAVSGANVAIVVGFVLLLAQLVRIRGRLLVIVGITTIAFFVILARPEPSVLRAAVMGTIALIAIVRGGLSRSLATLSAAVIVLLIIDPLLSVQLGFVLSVVATAGLIVVSPWFTQRLTRWMPLRVAQAIGIAVGAQLVVSPVLAAISGRIEPIAIVANVLAEPAVAPATVCGFIAAVVSPISPWLASLFAAAASWCAQWISWVASAAVQVPGGTLAWPRGLGGGLCVVLAMVTILVVMRARRTPWAGVAAVAVAGCLMVLPARYATAWPPAHWLVEACDVGQGDGLLLNTGRASAILVDAGPDARLIDRCLRDAGITTLDAVVLTHFHADHVDGLQGALRHRRVGPVLVSSLLEPAPQFERISALVAQSDGQLVSVVPRSTTTIGSWQIHDLTPSAEPMNAARLESQGSAPNNSSVVFLAQQGVVRVLMTGDIEEAAQEVLRTEHGAEITGVDVLKVPHHGSALQDPEFLRLTRPRIALISAGRSNRYGHPKPSTLVQLSRLGAQIGRTDQQGDVAVVRAGSSLILVSRPRA